VTVRLDDLYTLEDAARRLEVSPRRLTVALQRGEVVGQRLGRRWLVPGGELERARLVLAPVGRPLGQRLSWALLALLEGRELPAGLAREERSRVRAHLRRPLEEIVPRLRGRARQVPLSVSAPVLERLASGGTGVVGGARALRLVGSSRAASLDLYLEEGEYEHLLDTTLAVEDFAYPNLVVHLVEARYWPFQVDEPIWQSAALLDLHESGALELEPLCLALGRLAELRA
jgi:hypothetical protein